MKYLQKNNKIIVIKIPHINNKTNKKNTKEDKRKQKTIKQKNKKNTKQDIFFLLPETNQAIFVLFFVFSSIQIHLGRME